MLTKALLCFQSTQDGTEVTLKTEVEAGASGYSVTGGGDQGIFVKQVLKDSSAAKLFSLREGATGPSPVPHGLIGGGGRAPVDAGWPLGVSPQSHWGRGPSGCKVAPWSAPRSHWGRGPSGHRVAPGSVPLVPLGEGDGPHWTQGDPWGCPHGPIRRQGLAPVDAGWPLGVSPRSHWGRGPSGHRVTPGGVPMVPLGEGPQWMQGGPWECPHGPIGGRAPVDAG